MREIIDIDRYPLHQAESPNWETLVAACKSELAAKGLFNLPGFLRTEARRQVVEELKPTFASSAFVHAREHNIYFKSSLDGIPEGHPALRRFRTANHTICADQMEATALVRLYEWPPFASFLAAVLDKKHLYAMADPLARMNVMAYSEGEALSWHFDHSEFTTTLLLQEPDGGGNFEYAKDLRTDSDPNYDGVSDLLKGNVQTVHMPLEAGTLNVFRGKNTAHRVTSVEGKRRRIVAVFSYYENPGVVFSDEERLGFYGRIS